MTNPIKPQKNLEPVQPSLPQKQYRAYDPRRWGQWLVQRANKPKPLLTGANLLKAALKDKGKGNTTLYDREITHETNPEAALRLLERQKVGDRSPEISQDMTKFQTIGKGAFGSVETVFPDRAGPISVTKRALDRDARRYLEKEQELLAQCEHPNIVKPAQPLKKKRFNNGQSHMHMEYGGITLNALKHNRKRTVSLVKQSVGQLVDALVYLEGKKIIHFDIKPENILLNPNTGKILLADFGLAEKTGIFGTTDKLGGTNGYMAPEILQKGFYPSSPSISPAADVFSTGCVLFEMMTGCQYLPVHQGSKTQQRADLITRISQQHEDSYFRKRMRNVMPNAADGQINDAVDILMKMLHPDPKQRISPKKIANHPFFAGFCKPTTVQPEPSTHLAQRWINRIKFW